VIIIAIGFLCERYGAPIYAIYRNKDTAQLSRVGKSEWMVLCGNVRPGVKVYYGTDKTYWGTVIDSNDDFIVPDTGDTVSAVRVRMSDGSIEWKERKFVICGGYNPSRMHLFIRRDDPALALK
jgi:hypothetical protein